MKQKRIDIVLDDCRDCPHRGVAHYDPERGLEMIYCDREGPLPIKAGERFPEECPLNEVP